MPAVEPQNPLQSYHLRLRWAAHDLRVRVVLERDGQGNELPERPQFYRDTAPALGEILNDNAIGYQTVPPDQGEVFVIEDFSRGAGKQYYEKGHYAFGRKVATRSGRVYPGPELVATTLAGGGGFAGPVTCWCEHETTFGLTTRTVPWVGTEAGTVYYWDPVNTRWTAPPAQPAAGVAITDIVSHNGVIFVAHDNAAPYEYTVDQGAIWVVRSMGQRYAKFWAVEDGSAATGAVLINAVDPNLVFRTEDGTNAGTWDTGSEVGQITSSDHFTSVRVAPEGGLLLLGKELGWRTLDSAGNVGVAYGPVQPDSGRGTENFAWPVLMGGQLFAVVKDYGLVRYVNEAVPASEDLGPAAVGVGVPEMQTGIIALASDQLNHVFVALSGDEGWVMQGFFLPDGSWSLHGAYVELGTNIRRMWVSSSANPTDETDVENNQFLWLAPAGGTYLPSRALLPRTDLEVDADARFVSEWRIRFGKEYGAFRQEQKLYQRMTPLTRNLGVSEATLALGWRIDEDVAYTTLGSFNTSPEPSQLQNTYLPAWIVGKSIEVEAVGTQWANTHKAVLESIIVNYVSKHERKDALTAVVDAMTGRRTRSGGQSPLSAQQLEDLLFEARDYRDGLVLLTREWGDQRDWTVSLERVKVAPSNLKAGGPGTGQLITLSMQELDSVEAPANVIRLLEAAQADPLLWIEYEE